MNLFCLPAGHNQTMWQNSVKENRRVCVMRVVYPTYVPEIPEIPEIFEIPVVQTGYILMTPVKMSLGTIMFVLDTEVHREGQPVVRARQLLDDSAEQTTRTIRTTAAVPIKRHRLMQVASMTRARVARVSGGYRSRYPGPITTTLTQFVLDGPYRY